MATEAEKQQECLENKASSKPCFCAQYFHVRKKTKAVTVRLGSDEARIGESENLGVPE